MTDDPYMPTMELRFEKRNVRVKGVEQSYDAVRYILQQKWEAYGQDSALPAQWRDVPTVETTRGSSNG